MKTINTKWLFAMLIMSVQQPTFSQQLTTQEQVLDEITSPTMNIAEIIKQGDAVFTGQGTTPTSQEKAYARWRRFAMPRSTYKGATASNTVQDLASYVNTTAGNLRCSTGPSGSVWTSEGPNPTSSMLQAIGLVSCVAPDPNNSNIIYIGTEESGLWKTTDGGANWSNITDGQNIISLGITSISIDPSNTNKIAIGTVTKSYVAPDWQNSSAGYGILYSTDGGTSWNNGSLSGGSTPYWYVKDIARHPTNSNILVAAGNFKIYRSANGGASWAEVYSNPTPDRVYFLDVEFSINSPNTVMVSNRLGWGDASTNTTNLSQVFVSTTGGTLNSWSDVTPPYAKAVVDGNGNLSGGSFSIVLETTPAASNYMYAAYKVGSEFRLDRTIDGGLNWTNVASNPGTSFSNSPVTAFGSLRHEFELSDNNTSTMYAGGNYLYKSTDNGATWSRVTQYIPSGTPINSTHADIRGIHNLGYSSGHDNLLIANDGGIAKTTNSASSWTNLNGNGLKITQFFAIDAFRSKNEYVGGAIHNGMFHYDGSDWKPFTALGDGDWSEIDHFSNNENTTYGVVNGVVIRSNNSGRSYNGLPGQSFARFILGRKLHINPHNHDQLLYGFEALRRFDATTNNWTVLYTKEAGNNTNSIISVAKIAPSNPNVIYMAFEGPTWNQPQDKYKLYRSMDGGANWTNITTNLKNAGGQDLTAWSYVADIAIDPNDHNTVYFAMSNYGKDSQNPSNGVERVMKSTNGGNTWTDMSSGLPPVPVTSLLFYGKSQLYAGTDAGVYYKDLNGGNWQCFNNGLPNAMITKLEIDPCNEKIYAATLGRGLWKADLPSLNETTSINSNSSWSGEKFINHKLVVEAGNTLSITGKVFMGRKGIIEVRPTAHLVIDGGEITSKNCGDWWGGIYVAGNSNASQYTTHQGKVSIINGGTISNARDGITNTGLTSQNGWVWGEMGGIIYADNAIFRNNRRDIQLLSYSSTGGPHNGDYMAEFYNCTFERNDDFQIEAMLASITMWDVQGVKIKNCHFVNSNTGNFRYSGGAILSSDASYRIKELPNQAGTGCTFQGYAQAIKSDNFICNQNIKPIVIENAEFSDNKHSIYLSGTEFARIVNNEIEVINTSVPSPNPPPVFQPAHYGIYLDQSTGYQLHGNEVFTPGAGDNTVVTLGIVLKDNGTAANQVYDNEVDGFDIGIEAIGRNKSAASYKVGLIFRCNELGSSASQGTDMGNQTDIYVIGGNAANTMERGVAAFQGDNGATALPNNLFTANGNMHFNNNSPNSVVYFFGTGDPRLEPINFNNIVKIPTAFPGNLSQNCQARMKTGNEAPTDYLNQIALQEAELDLRINQRTALLNGGNTASLEAQILFAESQQDYQDLYVSLMEASPYVEESILSDLIELEDFPELALRNLFIANPHVAREAHIVEALENREPPLSQQTLDDIEAEEQTITSHDVVNMQIDNAQMTSEYATVGLIDYYNSADSDFQTEIQNHLKSRNETHFRYALVDQYFAMGLITEAENEISSIESECVMSDEEYAEYQSMQAFYDVVKDNIDDLKNISLTGLQALQGLVDDDQGYLSTVKARNLLVLNEESSEYVEPVYIPEGESFKKAASSTDRPTLPELSFHLSPNPSNGQTTLLWDKDQLLPLESFTVVISDISGKKIKEITTIHSKEEMQVINLSGLKPGPYILTALDREVNLFSEKLIIQ